MELGAVVCTPGRPRCGSCPVAAHCEALRQGRAASIPQARGAGPRRCVHHHAVVVRKGMLLLLERRPPRGMWAGMWQVPTVEAPRALPAAALRGALPVRVGAIRRLGSFRHLTTHRRVTFHVFAATSRAGRGDWFGASELADLPMGSAQRRVIRVALGIPEGVPVATGRRAPPNRTRSSKRSIRGSAVTAAGRPGGSCLHHAGSTTSLA
jgi:A/G-specific adenine glycosylase